MDKITLKFPGSIEHFRALIDELRIDNQYCWTSSKGETLAIWDYFEFGSEKSRASSKTSTWNVVLQDQREKQGVIQAFESLPNVTSINFYDGKSFNSHLVGFLDAERIGESFDELVQVIGALWEDNKVRDSGYIGSKPGQTLGKIEAVEYSGSVAHFRAWMDRFLAVRRKTFIIATGEQSRKYTVSYYPPARTSTREVWNIVPIIPVIDGKRAGNSRFAMILAIEDQANRTTVEFVDGQCYERIAYSYRRLVSETDLGEAHLALHEPIGEDFYLIAEQLKAKLSSPNQPASTVKKKQLRIFISYASEDREAVRSLYASLLYDGFDPWLDAENLSPGEEWQLVIPKEVGQSDIVLVCLSKRSILKTGYIQKEIKIALDAADERPEGTIFLIPIRLEECEIPSRLSKWQWLNYYESGGYQKLVNALRKRASELGIIFTKGGVTSSSESHPSGVEEQTDTSTYEDHREQYQSHRIREGETWESISEQEYGSAKFVKRIRDANNGRVYLPPKGSYISIPSIRLSSLQRENGKYVSLKMVNGSREKPAFCRAIIAKMERFEDDEWFPINTDENGALSWHHGGSDKDGFKEVFLSPEFINIARLPDLAKDKEMNMFIRQDIIFTHLVDRPSRAGKYRMMIEVQYRFGIKPRTEKWFGYLDVIDISDSDNRKLNITDIEDVNEWD